MAEKQGMTFFGMSLIFLMAVAGFVLGLLGFLKGNKAQKRLDDIANSTIAKTVTLTGSETISWSDTTLVSANKSKNKIEHYDKAITFSETLPAVPTVIIRGRSTLYRTSGEVYPKSITKTGFTAEVVDHPPQTAQKVGPAGAASATALQRQITTGVISNQPYIVVMDDDARVFYQYADDSDGLEWGQPYEAFTDVGASHVMTDDIRSIHTDLNSAGFPYIIGADEADETLLETVTFGATTPTDRDTITGVAGTQLDLDNVAATTTAINALCTFNAPSAASGADVPQLVISLNAGTDGTWRVPASSYSATAFVWAHASKAEVGSGLVATELEYVHAPDSDRHYLVSLVSQTVALHHVDNDSAAFDDSDNATTNATASSAISVGYQTVSGANHPAVVFHDDTTDHWTVNVATTATAITAFGGVQELQADAKFHNDHHAPDFVETYQDTNGNLCIVCFHTHKEHIIVFYQATVPTGATAATTTWSSRIICDDGHAKDGPLRVQMVNGLPMLFYYDITESGLRCLKSSDDYFSDSFTVDYIATAVATTGQLEDGN